jgi:RNA polymerase sigma factor (sigma-70 family)
MMSDFPPELHRLLAASPANQDHAWTRFLDAYSRLVLHVARSLSGDRDEAMDAYAYVLEQLRADSFSRLRAFSPEGRGKFSTWLVAVVRRLCLDHARRTHGRDRGDPRSERYRLERAVRRELHKLDGNELVLSTLVAQNASAEDVLSAAEVRDALAIALDTLEPADRLLVALRFEDDLPAQRIAQVLDLPSPFHVYRRLETITRTLRQHLKAHGIEGAAS